MKSEDYWELFFTLNLKKQTILDTLFSKNIFSLKKNKGNNYFFLKLIDNAHN